MMDTTIKIDNVSFEVDNGELTIDHAREIWSETYTIPLDEVPRLIEYLQSISENIR